MGHDEYDPDQQREAQRKRAALAVYVREFGLDPDAGPPPNIAGLLARFGHATTGLCERIAYEPDALRWLSAYYRFWADNLADIANDAVEHHTAELHSALDRILVEGA